MGQAIAPRSLRSSAAVRLVNESFENNSGRKVSAVAGLIAVASFSGAEAQQSNLPPVTVDAPIDPPRPAASKPSPDQIQGYRMFRSISTRKLSSQAARLSLPRKEVFVSGWARAILRASRRSTARLVGAWSFRLRV